MLDDRVQWTGQSNFYARPDAAALVQAIRQAASSSAAIRTVGLCVPGILDADRVRVTNSINVPGLMELPLIELVREALGQGVESVSVKTDAMASGTDIVHCFALKGRVMTLSIGTGVGCGVIDVHDDTLIPLRINGDSPGHFGQLDVSLDADAPIGPDGGRGSLEAYIGVPALRRDYGDDINAALERLTPNAPALLALARAIRIGHAIYRPNHVVLAGGIGTRLVSRLEILQTLIDADLTRVARSDRTLRCGTDDFHAARGAAWLAVNDV